MPHAYRASAQLGSEAPKRRCAGLTLLALCVGLVGYTKPAAAQDAGELSDMSLEELLALPTTTASGGDSEERTTAAGNVIVVRKEQIHNRGYRSVGEVLQNVPGLYITDDGSLTSVAVRGVGTGLYGGTRLVKIMINGTAVNFRPNLRAFLGPEYIPVEAIERIEVVKGPLSALYGANAFLATVNIVTVDPNWGTTGRVSARGVSTEANPGYGASAMTSHTNEDASILIAATKSHIDRSGKTIQKTFDAQDPTSTRYADLFADASRDDLSTPSGAFLQIGIRTEKNGRIYLDSGFQQLDRNAEFLLNSVLTHTSRESLQNYWSALRHENEWSEQFSTQASLAVSGGHPTRDDQLQLTGNRSRTFLRNFDYKALNAGFVATYEAFDELSIRMGVDAEVDDQGVLFYTARLNEDQGNRQAGEEIDNIPGDTERRQTMSDVGAHLQVRAQPIPGLPDLRLTANARVDRASAGEYRPPTQFSYRGGAVYKWSQKFITKVVAGRAFQAPSGVLLFAQPGFGVENNVIGNLTAASSVPSLEPQKLDSVEGTVYALVGEFASLEVSLFYQRLTDKIDFRTAGTDYVARNLGQAEYAGVESTLQLNLGRFRPYGNLATVNRIDDEGDSDYLPSYPKYVGAGGMEIELIRPRLYLNGQVKVVGPRGATAQNILYNRGEEYSLPSYTTVDASLSTGGLPLLGNEPKTYFTLAVQNLLDEAYSEAGFGGFDVPAAGRSAMFEVEQTF